MMAAEPLVRRPCAECGTLFAIPAGASGRRLYCADCPPHLRISADLKAARGASRSISPFYAVAEGTPRRACALCRRWFRAVSRTEMHCSFSCAMEADS